MYHLPSMRWISGAPGRKTRISPVSVAIAPRTVAAVMPGLQSIPGPGLNSSSVRKVVAPKPEPVDSMLKPVATDSAPLQPAPDAGEIPASVPGAAGSLAPQVVDSSGKRALKQILRTIGGSTSTDRKSPKR